NSDGYFYNNRGDSYCTQRTNMERGFIETNRALKTDFPDRYIDLIGAVIDEDGTVPVFTPDCRFISQDCRHLTIYGAQFYANIFEDQIGKILKSRKVKLPFRSAPRKFYKIKGNCTRCKYSVADSSHFFPQAECQQFLRMGDR
ncbi:MAG: hypothetical protein OSB73_19200, partial [Candidatus Latescibacteria bacterium]|nr:hypothetical protein [Candidatus Latescibacterota bacterium]